MKMGEDFLHRICIIKTPLRHRLPLSPNANKKSVTRSYQRVKEDRTDSINRGKGTIALLFSGNGVF